MLEVVVSDYTKRVQFGTRSCSEILHTEIKVPLAVENSELTKCSPFKSWSRSKYSHACFDRGHFFFFGGGGGDPNFCLPGSFLFLFCLFFSPELLPAF